MKTIKRVLLCALLLGAIGVYAQDDAPAAPPQDGHPMHQSGGPHRMPPGVGGAITAINGDTITLKTFRGETETVKVTSETRFRKDHEEAKLADFKVGDSIMVGGEKSGDGTWTARFIGTRPAMGNPADLGKTHIVGKVEKIEGSKLTIHRPDGKSQVISVDSNTVLRDPKGQKTLKLADIKVGDHVAGPGEVKDGTFVAKELNRLPERPMMGRKHGRGMRGGCDCPCAHGPEGMQPPDAPAPAPGKAEMAPPPGPDAPPAPEL